ncbi:MAG: Na(+)-translocating NADH-quinone reductase subunit C [Planctomycetaceae bacterium]|nr:Na(+)-translocating NADH-quinone reductase subunit C [Planctomycetaceae bacterium]
MPFNPNSVFGTLVVAVSLCLVCSLLVSIAAVSLRPMQEQNQLNKMRRNVLAVSGLAGDKHLSPKEIDELFEKVETQLVELPDANAEAVKDLEAGEATDYDQAKAAKDPELSIQIPVEKDIAGIKRREMVSKVYLVKSDAGQLDTVVLPIYGKGLWSTLYGFIALGADGQTVKGITFYQHAETPGLGGEVDNPKWKAQWPGKVAVNESGTPVLDVTKPGNASKDTEVDGLSGATITSNGVENTVKYWLGENGFGPYLAKLRESGDSDTNAAVSQSR